MTPPAHARPAGGEPEASSRRAIRIIDSHAHVDDEAFDADRDEVLARAYAAGVVEIVCVGAGADLDVARRAVALAQSGAAGQDLGRPAAAPGQPAADTLEQPAAAPAPAPGQPAAATSGRPAIWATVGVHPHHAAAVEPSWWPALEDLARADRVVGVGETGLDYYYDTSPRDAQRACFARTIALARAAGKPLVCHIRDAHADALRILREHRAGDIGGVIHCFTGTPDDAAAYVDLGFHISFSGVVTFRGKRSDPIRAAARAVPADRILVETDCPYLAPEPVRGGRNEPAFAVHTARAVAAERGTDAAELAALTRANTHRVFALT